MDVPALLRAVRGVRKISQRHLAELAGLPRSTLDRIEAGRSDPRVSTLVTLLGALGYELAVCTAQGRLLRVDEEREQLVDLSGRHFPAHWETRPVEWLDDWWGWWRKAGPRHIPKHTYWIRRPSIGFELWEDAT